MTLNEQYEDALCLIVVVFYVFMMEIPWVEFFVSVKLQNGSTD